LGAKRKLCEHNLLICEQCVKASDSAKRFADGVNAMITFHKVWEIKHHWIAINLQDGSVDSTIYETRADAMKHMHGNEARYFYFPIGNFVQGLKLMDAEMILMFQRDAYDSGLRITDTQEGSDPFLPVFAADKYRDLLRNALRSNV
jgi:hypothetical protein